MTVMLTMTFPSEMQLEKRKYRSVTESIANEVDPELLAS
jgi:hypothetical protein